MKFNGNTHEQLIRMHTRHTLLFHRYSAMHVKADRDGNVSILELARISREAMCEMSASIAILRVASIIDFTLMERMVSRSNAAEAVWKIRLGLGSAEAR